VKFNIDGRLTDWVAGATSSATIGTARLAVNDATNPSGIGVKLDPIAQIAKILNTLARWSSTGRWPSAMGFDGGSGAVVAGLAEKTVSRKVGLGEFIINLVGV
jgi:hypothetical protein